MQCGESYEHEQEDSSRRWSYRSYTITKERGRYHKGGLSSIFLVFRAGRYQSQKARVEESGKAL